MFQFSRFALLQSIFNGLGFPIRKSPDQFIFADPRSLSQLITSFIASESQGIPRVPFLTFFYRMRFCSHGYVFIFRIVTSSFCHCWLSNFVNVPLLSSQFFNYFFQYVKELLSSSVAPSHRCGIAVENSVENNGFEPLTPCVQGRCSSQLS